MEWRLFWCGFSRVRPGQPETGPTPIAIKLTFHFRTRLTSYMSSAPRKPAPRLARPAARYWKGKAPKGADDILSDSDEEEEIQQPEEEGDILIGDQDFGEGEDEEEPPIRAVTKPTTTKAINVSLKDVNISKDGKVIVAGREESGRTELEGGFWLSLCTALNVLCAWFACSLILEPGSEESSEEEEGGEAGDEEEVCDH